MDANEFESRCRAINKRKLDILKKEDGGYADIKELSVFELTELQNILALDEEFELAAEFRDLAAFRAKEFKAQKK